MCDETQNQHPIPSNNRSEIDALLARLYEAQRAATMRIQEAADYDALDKRTPDGFTVNDVLRMWTWRFWAHHRELVRARGPLTDDNSHFHVPHHMR